jgi:hypothetical protein
MMAKVNALREKDPSVLRTSPPRGRTTLWEVPAYWECKVIMKTLISSKVIGLQAVWSTSGEAPQVAPAL